MHKGIYLRRKYLCKYYDFDVRKATPYDRIRV